MQENESSMSAQPFSLWLRGLVVGASIMLASCAGTGLSGKTPEQLVEQRAQQRLDALMARDIDKVMTYTTPSYRARANPVRYASRYAGVINWTEARVGSVDCEEDRCSVKVMVTYQMNRPKMINTRPLDEIWIKVDGAWYIYHE